MTPARRSPRLGPPRLFRPPALNLALKLDIRGEIEALRRRRTRLHHRIASVAAAA